jgi:hypothetical protein
MLLTNTRVNLQYPSSFSWFREIWIFSKFWNFIRGGGGLAFLWKTRFFKNVSNSLFFNILNVDHIYDISESGIVKFPIFGDSFIFPKFWKNEFFWKKSRVVLVLVVSPMGLTNTRVNLQYPSSFSLFRVIWIFSKLCNFVKGGNGIFVKNLIFHKCAIS